jgi:phospholipid/cholesterol/gamma-HCH transport system substrate-binding protein
MKIPYEVRIGLMAVIAIFAAIWGYKFLKGQNFLSNDNQFYAFYDYADQLNVSAPVFVKGLEVGTITKIGFRPDTVKSIRVDFEVRNDINIHPQTTAYIISTGVLGGKAISLDIPGPCSPENCLKSGSELRGKNRNLLYSLLGEDDIKSSINDLTNSFDILLDSLDAAFQRPDGDSGLRKIGHDLQKTISHVESISQSLDEMLTAQAPLRKGLQNIESVTQNLNQNNGKINQIIDNISDLSDKINKLELELTLKKVNSTLEASEKGLNSFNNRLAQAEFSLNSIEDLIGKVKSGEGTLGKVIQDDQLYQDLDKAVLNLNLLLQDIRLNPDRYIKVSVFGKKSSDYNYPEEDPAFQD